MKIYITKYALTGGIRVIETPERGIGKDGVLSNEWGRYLPREWAKTEEEALEQFKMAKAKRIASLKKSLTKVREAKPKFMDRTNRIWLGILGEP